MTTMGLRGVLACAFIASTALLAGGVALRAAAAASEPYAADLAPSAAAGPGLLERFKRKACHISLAATHRDRSASRDRTRQCGE